MGDVVQFRRGNVKFERLGNLAAHGSDESSYEFVEKPAAKSSSGVLVSQGDNIACPTCGCRQPKPGAKGYVTKVEMKPGCTCICHRKDNAVGNS